MRMERSLPDVSSFDRPGPELDISDATCAPEDDMTQKMSSLKRKRIDKIPLASVSLEHVNNIGQYNRAYHELRIQYLQEEHVARMTVIEEERQWKKRLYEQEMEARIREHSLRLEVLQEGKISGSFLPHNFNPTAFGIPDDQYLSYNANP